MVGGGEKPKEAMARFVDWAGGEKARILYVPWSTEEGVEGFTDLQELLKPLKPASFELGVSTSELPAKSAELLAQIGRATGVFFSGGDQNRVADVFKAAPGVREALRARYEEGVVFGGTSAGTAIMSETMITGEGDFSVIDASTVEVRQGLGLLPSDIIVDQHFIRRQRENRLFGLLLERPGWLGVGVDEDTAFLVEDGRFGAVSGAGQVMIVEPTPGGRRLLLELLAPGERYDLKERKKL